MKVARRDENSRYTFAFEKHQVPSKEWFPSRIKCHLCSCFENEYIEKSHNDLYYYEVKREFFVKRNNISLNKKNVHKNISNLSLCSK